MRFVPSCSTRYGEGGRARYREDIQYNVAALSAAVDADDEGMFLPYIGWLKIVLVCRGVAADDIAESLGCMTPALTDDTAGEHVVAASYLPSALQQDRKAHV